MVSLQEMAEAHLTNVQKAIIDLQNQRSKIDEEIRKLSDYLQNGVDVLNTEKQKLEQTNN
jgi:peptidoglycan hydrolase CwlO-like protein